MRQRILKTAIVALGLCLTGGPVLAQGFVVNKKDGSKLYFPAEEVSHISLYDVGEGPESQPNIQSFNVNGVEFRMVAIEGGTFQMGASEQDSSAESDEKPAHQVTLDGFSIGETEVTQELWKAVMGSNPSYLTDDNKLPVEQVSWDDCHTFITKLNELTGQNFRLPTEAEWEYAARGGNQSQGYKYSGSNTNDEVAWYESNSDSETHHVASKKANELGLYDMSGNVWEWCQDWYGSYSASAQTNPTGPSTSSRRVSRGGSWGSSAGGCRVSYRGGTAPSRACDYLGFRLAQ